MMRLHHTLSRIASLLLVGGAVLLVPAHAGAAGDGNGVVFAYAQSNVTQTVAVTDLVGTDSFSASIRVASTPGYASDFLFRIEFLDAGDAVLTTVTPQNGALSTGTDPLTWLTLTGSLTSADANWASIAKVRITFAGDDGALFWAGNYGARVDEVTLLQVKPGGSTQLLANPDFADGQTSWTASWQACSGVDGANPCLSIGGLTAPGGVATTTTTVVVATTTPADSVETTVLGNAGATIPSTGSGSTVTPLTAIALLLAGTALVMVTRRRTV